MMKRANCRNLIQLTRRHWWVVMILLLGRPAYADEGMWLPLLMSNTHWDDMRSKGLRIDPEDIYSLNNTSLKDAVVHFGGGCTGMLVSDEGLMFTNHHCAYSRIQGHSTVEHDYLSEGFWAMERDEELPNIGLTASILIRVEDVTQRVLAAVNQKMSETDRTASIRRASQAIAKEVTDRSHYHAEVKPLYYGNQFILVITEVFRDVRLVGAPPSSVGKFGRDSDNWMWPRHTGDFAIFRIYADANNKPAEYDLSNVPYRPRTFFEISAAGIKEGDFTMVYGFPGRTQQYIPSWGIRNFQHHTYPAIVNIRDHELAVINHTMGLSDELRIQYTGRQARVANGWKLYRGVIPGLERFQVISKKEKEQQAMLESLRDNPEQYAHYLNLLAAYETAYDDILPLQQYNTYFSECFWRNPLFRFIFRAYRIPDMDMRSEEGKPAIAELTTDLAEAVHGFYATIDIETEKQILSAMVQLFTEAIPYEELPSLLAEAKQKYDGDYTRFIERLFSKSMFSNAEDTYRFFRHWKRSSPRRLSRDPLFALMRDIVEHYMGDYHPALQDANRSLDSLHRINMQLLLTVHSTELLYPDANGTLRIAYGEVAGSYPRDAIRYHHQTTLEGVLEKHATGHPDYEVPEQLLRIASPEYYHPYSTDGTMPVGFIANNHTTGGNSGSPVLNGYGHLIGINFDRAWEGTMSDLNFEPSICRNISVDIRYLLFITDKLGGASYLFDEMVIHRP